MEESLETFKALDPVAYLSKFTSSNTRPDSRPHHTARQTTLLPSILTRNSNGSSLITLGHTQIITGITLQVGTPSPSTPSQGEMDVRVTFPPLCSNQYNTSGRMIHNDYNNGSKSAAAMSYADPQSIESYVKRTVISSHIVDLEQLCIVPGKAAWKIVISCMVVNHDGNVVDGMILGISMALGDLILPPVQVEKKTGKVRLLSISPAVEDSEAKDAEPESNGKGKKLVFRKMMVPLTVGFFQGKMLVDPSLEEESLCEGMVTVVVDAMSLTTKEPHAVTQTQPQTDVKAPILMGDVLNLSKSGGVMSSMEEIAACVQLALGRAQELKPLLLLPHHAGRGGDDDENGNIKSSIDMEM
jgi:exosome complex component RRP43